MILLEHVSLIAPLFHCPSVFFSTKTPSQGDVLMWVTCIVNEPVGKLLTQKERILMPFKYATSVGTLTLFLSRPGGFFWKPWGYFSNPETIVKSVTYKHEWWTRWNLPPQAVSEEAECAAWKICLHSEAGATDRIGFNIGYNPQTVGSVRGYTITALLPWQFISPAWDWTKLLHTSKAEIDRVVEL